MTDSSTPKPPDPQVHTGVLEDPPIDQPCGAPVLFPRQDEIIAAAGDALDVVERGLKVAARVKTLWGHFFPPAPKG